MNCIIQLAFAILFLCNVQGAAAHGVKSTGKNVHERDMLTRFWTMLISPAKASMNSRIADGYRDSRDASSGMVEVRSGYRLMTSQRAGGPGGTPNGHFAQDYAHVAGAGDLDVCNGREGVTPEYPGGTYYYVVTQGFPYIPRCFVGVPDPSFLKAPPPFGKGGPPKGPPKGGIKDGPPKGGFKEGPPPFDKKPPPF